MEKIKVNMNPNPLDVQTIHASQNDNEAREWGFELHNNGDAIDSSEISDQLVFKAYKGGTEQILPENTSTPTTSPFLGDIRYPQGLLTDQEFTYRQSPTESDGLAWIKTIKGNTLVWNQLVADAYSHVQRSTALAWNTFADFAFSLKNGHKYLIRLLGQTVEGGMIGIRDTDEGILYRPGTGYTVIYTATKDTNNTTIIQGNWVEGIIDAYFNIFDLTAIGIDSLTDAEILQWFADYYPLPFYDYNQGSLLSFNGNGIKTVGFNQFNKETATDDKRVNNTGAVVDKLGQSVSDYIKVISGQRYYLNHVLGSSSFYTTASYDANKTFVSVLNVGGGDDASGIITIPQNIHYIRVNMMTELKDSVCVNISNTELNGTYEPYTSSTLSLPISTYFPTGMKSAGNVYDELTESKAITRVGQITINGSYNVYLTELTNCVRISLDHGRTDVKYPNPVQASNYLPFLVNFSQDSEHFYMNGASAIIFILKSKCGTTAESVKAYLNSNPLTVHYELATPTETSFTTASLVTENAEIPLSNEDGVLVGKCTEQLSAEPGFHDAKIKLSDGDGECYSNKIQLHVERSPQ